MNVNPEIRKDGLLAIWRGLTTEPVWKYQELPPFLLPELIKLDLVEASDSELSRVMWFWLRRPRLTLHESTALIVLALCALLSLTIAFVDWPLTSMTARSSPILHRKSFPPSISPAHPEDNDLRPTPCSEEQIPNFRLFSNGARCQPDRTNSSGVTRSGMSGIYP